jgi:Zn-dependent oligopeptidase
MNLEEQLVEAEQKRLRVEDNKIRKTKGLPSAEEEMLAQANSVVEELHEPEAVERVQNFIRPFEFIENARTEIDKLKTSVNLLSQNHEDLNQDLNALAQRFSKLENEIADTLRLIQVLDKRDKERTRLETDTLRKLNQYLDNWL